MKKFQFRLEPYHNVCRHHEELEEIRLNELLRQKAEIDTALHQAACRKEEAEAELSSQSEILAEEARIYRRYIQSLKEQIQQLREARSKLEARILRQKNALVEATRKRKVMDRLKERRLQEYQQQANRLEQQEADELFLQRQARGL